CFRNKLICHTNEIKISILNNMFKTYLNLALKFCFELSELCTLTVVVNVNRKRIECVKLSCKMPGKISATEKYNLLPVCIFHFLNYVDCDLNLRILSTIAIIVPAAIIKHPSHNTF